MLCNIDIMKKPDYVRIITEKDNKLTDDNGGCFTFNDVKIGIDGGKITVSADTTPIKFIGLRYNGKFGSATKFLGDAVERAYGNLEWQGFNPKRLMPWYFLASDKTETYGFGVKTGPDAFILWSADKQGITLWLDVRCGGKGVILGGETLTAAQLVSAQSAENETPFRFAQRFCSLMCDAPILPKQPVYGSNNWYYAYGNSSAEEIIRDTALLAELTEGIENRPYMVIDDCWQPLSLAHGAAGRPYDCGNIRFPDMAGLAAEMKKMGVKPGIWIRPVETYEMFFPDRLRCQRNGKYLDITEPDALKLIAEDVNRVTSWGYELVKFDFATIDVLGNFIMDPIDLIRINDRWAWHDRTKTNAAAIKTMYRTIKDNSNGAVIIGCNVVSHLAAGILDMHRSGDDTSGNDWDRTVVMGINTLAFRLAQHNRFFAIDADCVGITKNIDWKMNRRFLKLLALSGTPLFCSMKPSDITDEMKAELKEAFKLAAVQKNDMEPLDWFETVSPCEYLVDGEKYEFDWIEDAGMSSFHK